jgi:hypothetical protein
MTLALLHSEFPHIWGKFYFLFYQCNNSCWFNSTVSFWFYPYCFLMVFNPIVSCWFNPIFSCWFNPTVSCWFTPIVSCWFNPTVSCWLDPTFVLILTLWFPVGLTLLFHGYFNPICFLCQSCPCSRSSPSRTTCACPPLATTAPATPAVTATGSVWSLQS